MSEENKKEEINTEATEAVEAVEIEESKPKSNLIKYIIFGVSGLVLISGIAFGLAFMLKDDPKAEEDKSSEVVENSDSKKSSKEHASKNSTKEESHNADNNRDDNMELSSEDFLDADEEEFDAKAIEKIVDNLAILEYTPTESDLADDNSLSVEDSLAQLNWIEQEKIKISNRQKELDSREKNLNNLEKSVDAKLIRIEHAESNRTSQLAKLYDGMDSRAVAKLMMNLDNNTIVAILPRMKSKNAALVLQLLPSKLAAELSKQMITIADN